MKSINWQIMVELKNHKHWQVCRLV